MSAVAEKAAPSRSGLVKMHAVFAAVTGWEPLFIGDPRHVREFGIQPYPAYSGHSLAGRPFFGRNTWDAIRKAFAAIDAAAVRGEGARR